MKANRRRFLQVIGLAPVAGPLAAKAAADKTIAEAAGVGLSGLGAPFGFLGNPSYGEPQPSPGLKHLDFRVAMRIPAVRRQIEEAMYEQERVVLRIDPDLAALRSFSLNAKITFQRQRNVAREMDLLQNQYAWHRIQNAVRRFVGMELLP